MNTVEAIQTISEVSEGSVDLSPYSRLSLAAMTVGYETLLDVQMPQIAADLVSETVDRLVSSAVTQAMSALSSLPIWGAAVSAAVGGIVQIIENEMTREERERAMYEERVREQREIAARLRPVGSGSGGRVMPADLLARYLDFQGVEFAPFSPGNVSPSLSPDGRSLPPTIGQMLWFWGGAMQFWGGDDLFNPVRREDEKRNRFLQEAAGRATGFWGPSVGQKIVYHAAGNVIARSRWRPGTDGGVSLWPVMLDCLRSSESTAPRAYYDWLLGHYATHVGRVLTVRSSLLLDSLGPWSDAVAELRRAWKLTINPVYQQDRAEAAELRREIEAHVRRLLQPQIRLAAPTAAKIKDAVRRRRWRGLAVLGTGALGAAALVRPDLAAAAVKAVRRLA